MFDFKNANTEQKTAISHVDGPLLITAGPGTGKTFTLVQRIVYLIQECNVLPSEIMVTTFTEKASKELITRITNELLSRNITVDINEMYVGTFHSICLRFIKEHIEFTRIKKNYRLLDSFDQQYFVFQHINEFRSIENFESVINLMGAWKQSSEICKLVNNLNEELIDGNLLCNDKNPKIVTVGEILLYYNNLLIDNNILDFSCIQTEAYRLLKDNPSVLEEIHSKIKYIMVDEYQDTNYIQEQLVFLIAGNRKNITVVGDDDQGLYRFRGATIRNILEFPSKFNPDECKRVSLITNYRSDSKIVDFYNQWISTTDGYNFKFSWDNFRFNKSIKPHKISNLNSPSVIKVSGQDDVNEWYENVLKFINQLKSSGKLTDLNQIAFLFNSVKNDKIKDLASYLENNGINVYSPRSDMFFERYEIKLIIGCLILLFPNFLQSSIMKKINVIHEDLNDYYQKCVLVAMNEIKRNDNLMAWIRKVGIKHQNLSENTNYAFSGLIYQLFEFSPFKEILDNDLQNGARDSRPIRNLSILTQIVAKFEYLHNIVVLTKKNIDSAVEKLFNMYMYFLYNGGINEYEDDSEYAPSGCVSFLTIHQSKGMEFPIVVVGSLGNLPRDRSNDILDEIELKYFHRKSFEPKDKIKFFDFWRLYYTAFSRAQDLLVLTCNEHDGHSRTPSKYFQEVYNPLISFENPKFNINEFDFKEVKKINIKETYSFTSHISVYNTCALQYKFFKELGFTPVRVGGTIFGTLVHQTIEDIHRSVLRHEENLITTDNIKKWFDINYANITKKEHTYLAERQLQTALSQVLSYVDRQRGDWSRIQDAEVDVSLVKPNYILKGTIDLLKGDADTVEIVDFKSEKKLDIFKDSERIEHYKQQLQVYAYLVEEKTGKNVSKMHLYYTSAENENPIITFYKDKKSIDSTIQEFENIVDKIQHKDFSCKSKSQLTCNACDFRFYCSR